MKAVICSAGQGRRLQPLTNEYPKGLVMVGHKTILEYLLDNLSRAGIEEVIIVVGYKADAVKDKIGNHYGRCYITYVQNTDYLLTDNLYSLWLCRKFINDGMIFLNGDIIFNFEILFKLINNIQPDSLAVDDRCLIKDDAMKVRIDDNQLKEIGKKIVSPANGWAIGVYKLSQPVCERYFEISHDFFANGPSSVSFVKPLQVLARERIIIPTSTAGKPWVEIDDMEDYNEALQKIDKII